MVARSPGLAVQSRETRLFPLRRELDPLYASFAVAHDAARSRIRGRSLRVRYAHLYLLE